MRLLVVRRHQVCLPFLSLFLHQAVFRSLLLANQVDPLFLLLQIGFFLLSPVHVEAALLLAVHPRAVHELFVPQGSPELFQRVLVLLRVH